MIKLVTVAEPGSSVTDPDSLERARNEKGPLEVISSGP
jgi:hypothetical protein